MSGAPQQAVGAEEHQLPKPRGGHAAYGTPYPVSRASPAAPRRPRLWLAVVPNHNFLLYFHYFKESEPPPLLRVLQLPPRKRGQVPSFCKAT